MRGVMLAATLIVLGAVVSILGTILIRGSKALSWDMVSKFPGKEWNTAPDGGFLNAILGSLYVVVPAAVIGACISIPIVFYITMYKRRSTGVST